MKIVTLFLAVFLSVTAAASVNPYDILVRADASSRTITLRTTTDVSQDTDVFLRDLRGNELFRKTLRRGDFLSLRFELATLRDGDYELVIKDNSGCTTQPIRIDGTGVTADPDKATRFFYPVCRLVDGETLSVNYLNQRGQRVVISLRDDSGHEVFSETINGDTPIQRAYRLDKLTAGNYVVRIQAKTFDRHITHIRLE